MKENTEILEECALQIQKTFYWYEEKQPGLGDRFLESFETSLNLIAEHPGIGRRTILGLKRIVIKNFPYLVYYRFTKNSIQIVGCFYGRNDPNNILIELKDRLQ